VGLSDCNLTSPVSYSESSHKQLSHMHVFVHVDLWSSPNWWHDTTGWAKNWTNFWKCMTLVYYDVEMRSILDMSNSCWWSNYRCS